MTYDTEYEAISAYLTARGITLPFVFDEFDDNAPECICISDYFSPNEYDQDTGEDTPDYKNFNMIVRMLDKKQCYLTAEQIYRLFKNKSNFTIDNIFFMDFHAKGPPHILGKRDSGHTERTINFETKFYKN